MPLRLSANRTAISLHGDTVPPAGVLDVLIDGHRVWSTEFHAEHPTRLRLVWPRALRPYLNGRAELSLQEPATGATIAQGSVRIGRSATRISVHDAHGRRLAVNKWGRLSPFVAEDTSGMKQRIVDDAALILEQLTDLGYCSYITGGTLLGALRSGDVLPHDDDADLGVLLPLRSPADLSLASYRLEDQLTALGHTVIRHSGAHLQLVFTRDGRVDHYVDVFSAFYRSEHEFCQPIHVRADVPAAAMTPLVEIPLGGRSVAANPDPDSWLTACYGPEWRIPDPSFRFETPSPTRRRFENWFGSQNAHREFWNAHFDGTSDHEVRNARADGQHSRALSRLLPAGAPVLDIGCGTGDVARLIASHGHPTMGVDYSDTALALAQRLPGSGVEWRHGNLSDRRRMLELAAELVRDGRRWHVSARHVVDGMTVLDRATVFLFIRCLLRGDASAVVTVDTDFHPGRYVYDDPRTWHLPLDVLTEETRVAGLDVEVLDSGRRISEVGRRTTLTVALRRRRKE